MSLIWSISGTVSYTNGSWAGFEMRQDEDGYSETGPDMSAHPEIVACFTNLGLSAKTPVSDPTIADIVFRFSILNASDDGVFVMGGSDAVLVTNHHDAEIVTAMPADDNFTENLTESGPVSNITLDPDSSYMAGNAYVVITGSGFNSASGVKFGDQDAQWYSVESDTEIHAFNFPVSSSGDVDVTVLNVTIGGLPAMGPFTFASKSLTGTLSDLYPADFSQDIPKGICSGPDGKIWTVDANDAIWSWTTSGVATIYNLVDLVDGESVGEDTRQVIVGPDGNLWVADSAIVWKVTTAGVATAYPVGADLYGMCVGSDGNLWATDGDSLWKITTDGDTTEYAFVGSSLLGICAGPDGNLWILDNAGDNGAQTRKVWKVTTAGVKTSYNLTGSFLRGGICAGPDGNIWLTDFYNKTWSVTMSGVATAHGLDGGVPTDICAGPDGNLWASGGNKVWKLTTGGTSTAYTGSGTFTGMCVGPDGNIWIIDSENEGLVKVS